MQQPGDVRSPYTLPVHDSTIAGAIVEQNPQFVSIQEVEMIPDEMWIEGITRTLNP